MGASSKTASARKGKDPHLRFRIAFEEVEGRELKEDKWKRLTNNVLVFTCRKYFPFHFFSFLFISFFWKKEKKKRTVGGDTDPKQHGKTKKNKQRSRQSSHKLAAVHYYYYFLHFCFLGAFPLKYFWFEKEKSKGRKKKTTEGNDRPRFAFGWQTWKPKP